MGRHDGWSHAQLVELAQAVERGVSWHKLSAEYQMTENWLRERYRKYRHLRKAGKLNHLSPFDQMNLYLDWVRGMATPVLSATYRISPEQVQQQIFRAQELLRRPSIRKVVLSGK